MLSREAIEAPGTYVFDGAHSRRGYRLNKMFMSLREPVNRELFARDEAAYCDRFQLDDEQRQAVLGRDWTGMLDLGGSIFYVFKLAMVDNRSMQYLGGVFSGMSEDEFVRLMRGGGRSHG